MSDKMPTSLWVTYVPEIKDYNGGHYLDLCIDETEDDFPKDWAEPKEQYTIVHNNPDYHVIKKSDVDGDAMGALMKKINEDIDYFDEDENTQSIDYEFGNLELTVGDLKSIRNALIAQSDMQQEINNLKQDLERAMDVNVELLNDKDMVTIPRKVLEGMRKKYIKDKSSNISRGCYNLAINEVLNYKEGE